MLRRSSAAARADGIIIYAICNGRSFRVRCIANYIDSGFDCCGLLS